MVQSDCPQVRSLPMKLRAELQAPAIASERLAALRERIQSIEALIETDGLAAHDAIHEFNQITGRDFSLYDFQHYWRSVSLDDFARRAARPRPQPHGDLTREELIEIVRRAMPTSGDPDY